MAFAFWAINGGLALMVLLSVLPVGLLQTWASVEHGTWYARSAEFLQTPQMERLRWMRLFGDSIFAIGVIALAWFLAGVRGGWSLEREGSATHPVRRDETPAPLPEEPEPAAAYRPLPSDAE